MRNGGGYEDNFIIESCFISDDCASYNVFNVSLHDGSGRLISRDSNNTETNTSLNPISLQSLDNLITKHHFEANFIKIDTDGFDFKVLRSALQSLERLKSTIYFEWDRFFLEDNNENPISIFPILSQIGYDEIIVFDNFGDMLCRLHCNDTLALSMLMDYSRDSNKRICYYDMLIFHKDSGLNTEEFVKFIATTR